MGLIRYSLPVESMSGKFAKQAVKAGDGCAFFIGNYRAWSNGTYRTFYNCKDRNFDPRTADQIDVRQKFTIISSQFFNWLVLYHPEYLQNYTQGFSRQLKYKTLRTYMMAKAFPYITMTSATTFTYNPPYAQYPLPNY